MPVPTVLDLFPSFYNVQGPNPTITGQDLLNLVKVLFSSASGISVTSSNGVTGSVLLTAAVNQVTSGTAAGAVMLPPAAAGQSVDVICSGSVAGTYIQVYGYLNNSANPSVNDQIIAHNSNTVAATGTGVQQATATMATYTAYTTGIWKQQLSA